MTPAAIKAQGLTKSFGKTRALAGLDLEVEAGSIFSLLGPNGAGKTTAIRILTTLLTADSGTAQVAGFDVIRDAAKLRAEIGLTGQYAAVDELLTGKENLVMVGRLTRLDKSTARRRSLELLEHFELTDAQDRIVKTYSGGMRRRLDLAASLIGYPKVVFLDEPTSGLDPRSRLGMWQMIRELARGGTTILLTTQYLEEADELAERILVIDQGKQVALGTPTELKKLVGGERIQATIPLDGDLARAARVLEAIGEGEVNLDEERRSVSVGVSGGVSSLAAAVKGFEKAKTPLEDLALRRPTLDEVFLQITGHPAEEEERNNGSH